MKKKTSPEPRYLVIEKTESGQTSLRSLTLLKAHVHLGRIAEKHNLEVVVHEGRWVPSARSIAYTKDGDPLLNLVAYVKEHPRVK